MHSAVMKRSGNLRGAAFMAGAACVFAFEAMLVREANDLVERDFADTVILTGAVMAGVAARIQSRVPVPVLDGIAAGVPQAELLARARYPKPTRGSYALPGKRELVNVDAAVVKRYS